MKVGRWVLIFQCCARRPLGWRLLQSCPLAPAPWAPASWPLATLPAGPRTLRAGPWTLLSPGPCWPLGLLAPGTASPGPPLLAPAVAPAGPLATAGTGPCWPPPGLCCPWHVPLLSLPLLALALMAPGHCWTRPGTCWPLAPGPCPRPPWPWPGCALSVGMCLHARRALDRAMVDTVLMFVTLRYI